MMNQYAIQVKNFEQKFKKFKLSNVNFNVNKGKLHALIGESGSGKTVILKSIIGALPNYKGEIKIFDYNAHHSLSKSSLGFSSNLEDFPNEISAYQFLFLLGNLSSLPRKALKHNIKLLMLYFNLWESRNKKLRLYSSGMKNRIMIIHAMITNPDLIIFDEPGANLDYKNRVKFYYFLSLQKKVEKTIFLTTHMIDEIEPLIDECTIIDKGKLLYSGPYNYFTNQSDYQISVSNPRILIDFFSKNGINFGFNKEKNEFVATLPYNINLNKFFNFSSQNNLKVFYFREIKNDLEQLKIKLSRLDKNKILNNGKDND